jgi:hypothetical protein
MVLIFTGAAEKLASSNKPPIAAPDPILCKDAMTFSDGRTVWRSNIRPDRITAVGYLQKKQFGLSKAAHVTLGEVFAGMLLGLKGFTEGEDDAKHWVNGAVTKGWFLMPCGPRGAKVRIDAARIAVKGEVEPAFRFRMEFCPRKLGPQGISQLIVLLEQCSDVPFNVGMFLSQCGITRYDAAVDFVGVLPAELLATIPNHGKTIRYSGNDGSLETLQLHRKRAIPKMPTSVLRNPAGALGLKLYDRSRERAARCKPVPVPGHEVTRAEVVKLRFANGLSFFQLPEAKPFEGIGLSYFADISPGGDHKTWRVYLGLLGGVGHLEAAKLLGLSAPQAKLFNAAFRQHPNSLLSSLGSHHWQSGLAETGLDQLIDLAVAQS